MMTKSGINEANLYPDGPRIHKKAVNARKTRQVIHGHIDRRNNNEQAISITIIPTNL